MPYRNIGFSAILKQLSEFLYPTPSALVCLTKAPYLVISLEDLEVVALERVTFNNRTFDMTCIYKDYTKPVTFINAVPMANLDTIKAWLE